MLSLLLLINLITNKLKFSMIEEESNKFYYCLQQMQLSILIMD